MLPFKSLYKKEKCSGNIHNWLYSQTGELSAYLSTCLTILSMMCLLALVARNITSSLEQITGVAFHQGILQTFGLTPFLDTYPDLLAGTIVSIPAVVLAVGIEVGSIQNSLLQARAEQGQAQLSLS